MITRLFGRYGHVATQEEEEDTENDDHHQSQLRQEEDTEDNLALTPTHADIERVGLNQAEDTIVGEEEKATSFISIDTAIERLGYGWFQKIILVAAGLCFAADAMQVMLLSFLSIQLQTEWDLSSNQVASLTAALFAGAFTGC
jgi:hypothetical protein